MIFIKSVDLAGRHGGCTAPVAAPKVALPLLLKVLLLAALSLTSACQMLSSDLPRLDENSTPDTEQAVVVRQPNPYLAIRPSIPSAASQRFDAALQALQQQQWEIAETDLLWLTENYPTLSGPYLNLAMLYQRERRADQLAKVEPTLQQAIAANSSNVSAYNQLGIYLRSQGKFAEAERVYQQALAVWSDSPETHLNLGILYDLYMGKLDQALIEYRAYQDLQDEPDRQVQGWIVDTERRLADQPVAEKGGES